MLESIDSVDEIKLMVTDPAEWMKGVMKTAGPLAKRIIFSNIKANFFARHA